MHEQGGCARGARHSGIWRTTGRCGTGRRATHHIAFGAVVADTPAADPVAHLSGRAPALPRLQFPPGAAVAPERSGRGAVAVLLVGSGIGGSPMARRSVGYAFAAVLTLALAARPAAAAPAPGSVEPSAPRPTAPATPPATTAPATTAPATTAPATTAPTTAPAPDNTQASEGAKQKSDAKPRRRVVRHRYRYRYARDPFYYWHPRFWFPFHSRRYYAYRYPGRAYHRRYYRYRWRW
jgi:hypothetical protein